MEDISKLADILRENGEKILKDESKLTLSVDLLNKLNNSYNLLVEQRDMNSSFHVVSNASVRAQYLCDLQFLHEFIQKSTSLKLIPAVAGQLCNELIDLSKLKYLKLLEIYKVNVSLLLGIETLQRHLQYLICVRSIRLLRDILWKCDADGSKALVWSELKEAVFTHNNLQNIDNSIEFAPWLSSLDLSHNDIEQAEILCCLTNLKYLNLGYNKLNKVPSFTGQICNRLQVLVLCNNFIENIQEITNLVNLCELDLTENCLIEHNLLLPLSCLATLQWLNIKGNPLSYHPRHRSLTCCYLHMNTATVKFCLDEVVINKQEQQLIGSLHSKQLCKSPAEATNADIFFDGSGMVTERNRRVRYAKINDENVPPELDIIESIATLFKISEPTETKRQLENLHKEYMKSLYIKSGSLTHEFDLQSSPPFSPASHSSEFPTCSDDVNLDSNDVNLESTNYFSACNSFEKTDELSDIYSNKPEKQEELFEPSDDELESGENNIFLATLKGTNDDVIVILTKTHLTEKDPITMTGLGRFALDTLTSCHAFVESDVSYIHIEFDTVRTDRSRNYHFVDEEAQTFHKRLKSIINSKPPEKNMFVTYCCMKCSTQFGVEKQKTMHQQSFECPNCFSDLVYQDNSCMNCQDR